MLRGGRYKGEINNCTLTLFLLELYDLVDALAIFGGQPVDNGVYDADRVRSEDREMVTGCVIELRKSCVAIERNEDRAAAEK